MISLNNLQNKLPHFMPNQVLTHTQLNAVVDYLEQQERLTRQRLAGIGIVCGLQVNLVTSGASATVQVSEGCGVTSEGLLVSVDAMLTLNKKHNYTAQNYTPFNGLSLLELLPDNTSASDATALTTADTTGKIAVLFMEVADKQNAKCLGEDCDEKGNNYVYTLRVLLMAAADADTVLKNAGGLGAGASLDDFFNAEYELPVLYIERFGNTTNNPADDFNLPQVYSYSDFETDYNTVINETAARIDAALVQLYKLVEASFLQGGVFAIQLGAANLFKTYAASPGSFKTKIAGFVSGAQYKKGGCQYLYDFLRDVIDTYHGLVTVLYDYYADCCPPYAWFPQHLMLGEVKATVFDRFVPDDYSLPTMHRNYFISSYTNTLQAQYYKRIEQIIQRLQLQIDSLDFTAILTSDDASEPIKIIPDKTPDAPLAKRSIPFYYNPAGSEPLYKYWSFDNTTHGRPYGARAYFADKFTFPASATALDAAFFKTPVLFDVSKYPKLTIQGHVGKQLNEVIDTVTKLRKQYNLSFDILALKLGPLDTGVAIADYNLIAPLQLQYNQLRNGFICCVEEAAMYTRTNIFVLQQYLFTAILIALGGTFGADNEELAKIIDKVRDAVDSLLSNYNDALDQLVTDVPEDITKLNFDDLFKSFTIAAAYTEGFMYAIDMLRDVEFYLAQKSQQLSEDKKPYWLVDKEYWIGHDICIAVLEIWRMQLDKIAKDCILSQFYTIYKNYYDTVKTFSVFSAFNSAIHGMEHIAGTTSGGTFIIVYDDFVIETSGVSGKVENSKGEGIAGANIYGAASGIKYGVTNAQGKYNIKVNRKHDEELLVSSPNMVTQKIDAKQKDAGTLRLQTHSELVNKTDWRAPAAVKNIDKIYVRTMGNIAALRTFVNDNHAFFNKTGAAENAKKITAAFSSITGKIKAPIKEFQTVPVNDGAAYTVVADFYLPHPVHNYRVAVAPLDACKYLRGEELIDWSAITQLFGQVLNFKAQGISHTFYAAGVKSQNVNP